VTTGNSTGATIFTRSFWADALERAVKGAANGLVLTVGGGVIDWVHLDWQVLASAGIGGAVLSVLTSIASAPFASPGTASLSKAVEAAPQPPTPVGHEAP
jgi:hypothetical protein